MERRANASRRGVAGRRPGGIGVVALMCLAVAVVVVLGRPSVVSAGRVAAQFTADSRLSGQFEYIVTSGAIDVYSIDRDNRLVGTMSVPQIAGDPHGVVASPTTGRLYISFGGRGGSTGNGSLLAFDLRRDRIIWVRHYQSGIDSMAISPDGRKIYMPAGEASGEGTWTVIDAATGNVGVAIDAGAGAHDSIMGPGGRYVYLGGVDYPYLEVASTATNRVVRKIGPLNGPGVRPFTINGSQTLAFTTATSFLGFQVSSIRTGKVLHTAPTPGFSWNPKTYAGTPDHGISLSPDERELYLLDSPNSYVHVFDVSRLPAAAPRDIADIKLAHPPANDGWLQHSRNGRYVYVGRAGDVIDTKTRKVVAYLPPLQTTADFLEIDWRNGRPVATTNRPGIGYLLHP